VAWTAGPGPFCVPFQRTTAETVDAGALRTGRCVGLAPEVLVSVNTSLHDDFKWITNVVDSVASRDLATPLVAVVGPLLYGCGRCCESERSGAG
jgi:hypothetical protein